MIEQPMENRKWFQKRDLLLILLVGAAAAVLFFWPKEQGAAAVISQEGRELYCIDLTQVEAPYDISIGGEYPLVIHVEKGAVCFQGPPAPIKSASAPAAFQKRTRRRVPAGKGHHPVTGPKGS